MNDRPELTFRIIIEGIVITLLFVGLLFYSVPEGRVHGEKDCDCQ